MAVAVAVAVADSARVSSCVFLSVSFEPVRYGDYLMERLDANYSWKGPPRTMATSRL